jgi:hypothetical protein
MRDLGTQLRAYYDRISRPTDPEDVVAGKLRHDMTEETRVAAPWWRRPAAMVTAGALATLLIVSGGVFMLTSGDDGNDVIAIETSTTTLAPEATSTVPPTTTSTEAPTTSRSDNSESREIVPPNLEMTWTRIDSAVFDDAWITSITEGGPGLVAVGYVLEEPWPADWHSDGAVWVSSTGTEWDQVGDAAVFSDSGEVTGSDEFLIDVVGTADGFAALGWIDGFGYARFESTDGLEWSLTPDAVDPDTGLDRSLDVSSLTPAEVYAVVPFGDGFVAVGRSGPDDPTGMIWISDDGQTWERVADEMSDGIRQFESVSVDPSGSSLLAFGWDKGLGSFSTLISFDGVTWTEVGTLYGQVPPSSSAAYDDGRLVIVGLEWTEAAGVHVSDDDGATMYRLDPENPAFAGDMSDVVLFGDMFIAVGGDRGFPQQGQIWGGDPMLGNEGRGAVWIGTWNE